MQVRGEHRKQQKIKFLKSNEDLIREVFSTGLDHKTEKFLIIATLAKNENIYSKHTVPKQIFTNLFNVARKYIGWRF